MHVELTIICVVAVLSLIIANHGNIRRYITVSGNPVYVTMTTLPERLVSLHFRSAIKSIFSQSVPPKRVVLNIPHIYRRTGEIYVIPSWIKTHRHIIVNRCNDVGPATKILGGLAIIPQNALVVVCDDDIVYRKTMIETLVRHCKVHGCIVSNSSQTVVGFAGYIVPRKKLNGMEQYMPPSECYTVDDIWLDWVYRQKLNIPVVFLNMDVFETVLNRVETDKHPQWFELCKHTPRSAMETACLRSISHNQPFIIPRHIFMTYKTRDLPLEYVNNVTMWQKISGWEIKFYSDEDIYDLFLTHFPDYYNDVKKIKIGAILADLFRYAVLYIYGGMYTDIDTVPYRQPPEYWRTYRAVVGYEYQPSKYPGIVGYTGGPEICQWTLLSSPGYKLFKDVLDQCIINVRKNKYEFRDVEEILVSTGPHIFTDFVNKHSSDDELLVLDAEYFGCPKIPRTENSVVMHQFHGWRPGGWAYETMK